MALLSGARNQRNSSLSADIYRRMEKNFPNYKDELVAAAVLLANTYQSAGDLEKATVIKKKLNVEGAKRKRGLSWTEVNRKIFVSKKAFHWVRKIILCLEIWCT